MTTVTTVGCVVERNGNPVLFVFSLLGCSLYCRDNCSLEKAPFFIRSIGGGKIWHAVIRELRSGWQYCIHFASARGKAVPYFNIRKEACILGLCIYPSQMIQYVFGYTVYTVHDLILLYLTHLNLKHCTFLYVTKTQQTTVL